MNIIDWKLRLAALVSEAGEFNQPENVSAFLVNIAMAVRKGAGLPNGGLLGAAAMVLDEERFQADERKMSRSPGET